MSPPASPAALYAQAVAEFRQGRLQQALLVLGQLLQRVPSHADGWNLVGVIHGSRRQYAQAAQCHRRAIAAGAPNGTWVNLGLAEQRRTVLGREARPPPAVDKRTCGEGRGCVSA